MPVALEFIQLRFRLLNLEVGSPHNIGFVDPELRTNPEASITFLDGFDGAAIS